MTDPVPPAELPELVAVLRRENDQLRAALGRRPVIDLAKGVVMAVTDVGETAAFSQLSEVSGHHNVKVYDLARAVVGSFDPSVLDGEEPVPAVARDVADWYWLTSFRQAGSWRPPATRFPGR